MRSLTAREHHDLSRIDSPGEVEFSDALDTLETARRVERFDVDPIEETYRMRSTELGRLALKLWPTIRT